MLFSVNFHDLFHLNQHTMPQSFKIGYILTGTGDVYTLVVNGSVH